MIRKADDHKNLKSKINMFFWKIVAIWLNSDPQPEHSRAMFSLEPEQSSKFSLFVCLPCSSDLAHILWSFPQQHFFSNLSNSSFFQLAYSWSIGTFIKGIPWVRHAECGNIEKGTFIPANSIGFSRRLLDFDCFSWSTGFCVKSPGFQQF